MKVHVIVASIVAMFRVGYTGSRGSFFLLVTAKHTVVECIYDTALV